MKALAILCSLAALALPDAQAADEHAHHGTQATAPAAPLSEGELRKLDKAAGTLTIKHGELKNLGMPPMTMVFQVADKRWLDTLKPGDRLRFTAEQRNGSLVITALEVQGNKP